MNGTSESQTNQPAPGAKASRRLTSRLSAGSLKPRKTLRALFCEAHHCPPQEFNRQVFERSLYRHARPFARVLSRFSPDFFKEDFGFLSDLATTTCRGEVLTELNRFYGRNVRDRNWIRKTFVLRISGKRVLHLARTLFREHAG